MILNSLQDWLLAARWLNHMLLVLCLYSQDSNHAGAAEAQYLLHDGKDQTNLQSTLSVGFVV